MIFPTTAAVYAGVFGALYAARSAWVVAGRVGSDTLHGDGGDASLARRIRVHGNFVEYVPFILLLAALYEGAGGAGGAFHALLAPLVVARIAHPFGMFAPENSLRQYVFRGAGICVTLAVLVAASLLLVLRVV